MAGLFGGGSTGTAEEASVGDGRSPNVITGSEIVADVINQQGGLIREVAGASQMAGIREEMESFSGMGALREMAQLPDKTGGFGTTSTIAPISQDVARLKKLREDNPNLSRQLAVRLRTKQRELLSERPWLAPEINRAFEDISSESNTYLQALGQWEQEEAEEERARQKAVDAANKQEEYWVKQMVSAGMNPEGKSVEQMQADLVQHNAVLVGAQKAQAKLATADISTLNSTEFRDVLTKGALTFQAQLNNIMANKELDAAGRSEAIATARNMYQTQLNSLARGDKTKERIAVMSSIADSLVSTYEGLATGKQSAEASRNRDAIRDSQFTTAFLQHPETAKLVAAQKLFGPNFTSMVMEGKLALKDMDAALDVFGEMFSNGVFPKGNVEGQRQLQTFVQSAIKKDSAEPLVQYITKPRPEDIDAGAYYDQLITHLNTTGAAELLQDNNEVRKALGGHLGRFFTGYVQEQFRNAGEEFRGGLVIDKGKLVGMNLPSNLQDVLIRTNRMLDAIDKVPNAYGNSKEEFLQEQINTINGTVEPINPQGVPEIEADPNVNPEDNQFLYDDEDFLSRLSPERQQKLFDNLLAQLDTGTYKANGKLVTIRNTGTA